MSDPQDDRLAREVYSARAQFQALLDAAVDAIVLIDRDGLIVGFNHSAERLFGYTSSEVMDRNVRMLMPEPYRAEHDSYIQRYRRTREPRIIGVGREVTARRKDGTCFPVDLSVGEIADDTGPARFVGILRDLTQRKAAEHEMVEHRERLAHLTRLGTIGEMTTAIAHEINQPLTAISSYAQACERMLRAGTSDEDELADTLGKIGVQARRAGEVIRHLRRLVKQRDSETEVTDVNELIHDLLHLARVDSRAQGLAIRADLAGRLPPIEVDPIQIQQVILNLIRNAVDAMGEWRADDTILVTSGLTADGWIEIRVIDSGPGIPAHVMERQFEPFLTTKPEGLGVGVSICRSIVESHGGRLAFEKNEPAGTVARFVLPALPAGAGHTS